MATEEKTTFFFDRKVNVSTMGRYTDENKERLNSILQLATLEQLGFRGAVLDLPSDAIESVQMRVAYPGDILEEFIATIMVTGKAGQMSSVRTCWRIEEGGIFTRVTLP